MIVEEKTHEIADIVGGRCIIHEYLHIKKLSAIWVPHLLTMDQKLERKNISKGCLELFKYNPEESVRCFITVDETRIHYYTPQTKE